MSLRTYIRHGVVAAAFLLASACGQNTAPSWSLGEADLLFMSDRDGNAEIYLESGAQEDWINLTNHDAGDNWPQWSPDGTRIAFQSARNGTLDIWVMDADGRNQQQLTDDPAHDYLPAWSPDGSRLTFASWRMEPGDTAEAVHVYIMNADGTGQRRLIPESPGRSSGAMWDPAGNGFLLTRRVGEAGSAFFLYDGEGQEVGRLPEEEGCSPGAPEFSPDGSRIAYYCDRGESSDIRVMNRDGTDRRVLVSGGQAWYPRWSPDGRWITYTAAPANGAEGDLDIMAVSLEEEGEPIPLLTGPHRETESSWRPGG